MDYFERRGNCRSFPFAVPKRVIHRLTALILLFVYSVMGTSLLPAAIAALGTLEGSHEIVVVGQSGCGTQVVLHHRPGQFTPQARDHRTCLARAIVRFCGSDRRSDHCIATQHLSNAAQSERNYGPAGLADTPPVNEQATASLLWLSCFNDEPVGRMARSLRSFELNLPNWGAFAGSEAPMLI